MKNGIWMSCCFIAFSLWAAYSLMRPIDKAKKNSAERFLYSVSQFFFYIITGILIIYVVNEFVGLDIFQQVLLFIMLLLLMYVACSFLYERLKFREFPDIHKEN